MFSPEKYIILLSVFAVVFGTTLYVQTRIYVRFRARRNPELLAKMPTRLIDWLILIAVTGLLAYIVR